MKLIAATVPFVN